MLYKLTAIRGYWPDTYISARGLPITMDEGHFPEHVAPQNHIITIITSILRPEKIKKNV